MTEKQRPLVDVRVYDLAADWIGAYATADSEAYADAVWDLARSLQQSIESWTEDALITGRLRLASRERSADVQSISNRRPR